eukprot:scaffold14642_cov36-Cyclotella_meneghiniana.AAC.1
MAVLRLLARPGRSLGGAYLFPLGGGSVFLELVCSGAARLDDVRGVGGCLDYNNVVVRGAPATMVGRLTEESRG